MVVVKSVRESLIEKLADTMDPDNAAEFVAEFERSVGLQPGVAYMPVPRCDQCRWWENVPNIRDIGIGRCERTRATEIPGPEDDSLASAISDDVNRVGAELRTYASFGCVQWEPK